jgi:predicted nucleotidyltransferase
MTIAGIISEYNPFHNGHKYHIDETLRLTGSDAVICLMSGDFVQRGNPSVISKWARAKSAVLNGADLVFELPVIYSTASAEAFASGAVKVFQSLGIIDYLSFGSESDDMEKMKRLASFLSCESDVYKKNLKVKLSEGCSFPEARQYAVSCSDESLSPLLNSPNNILAVEYLKALKISGSDIMPVSVKRICSDHRSAYAQGKYSSAASIREMLKTGTDVSDHVPAHSLDAINRSQIMDMCDFSKIIMYILRSHDREYITSIDYMNDGLAEIFIKNKNRSDSIEELISLSANKRHTGTRISRALINLLLGITRICRDGILSDFDDHYARILAFNDKGAKLLSEIKRKGSTKIITKAYDYKKRLGSGASEMFELDLRASDIYNTVCKNRFIADISVTPFILR